MLAKRIIPCLDVKNGLVVKGVKFRGHKILGSILDLAIKYRDQGADEIVFYDITASADSRTVDKNWISIVAKVIDIPFCVAGGIRSVQAAREILYSGADKISINTPAIQNPDLINLLSNEFGKQCVVVGIDSKKNKNGYSHYKFTGNENKTIPSLMQTKQWIAECQSRGAGEIVLNCMNNDGLQSGYAIQQLNDLSKDISIPIVASGGAGSIDDFYDVFTKTNVSAALAASVFHTDKIKIDELKRNLRNRNIEVRL